ncbi:MULTISPECIES: hypothetical protein [Megamonas]|jgi:hypothetical protein|uniref:hypothetical protein n=1 Tax=Megamonas TaxID=158846 RepID=UPI00258766BB|nr:hypothetical protein [Megamonas sp.]
MATNVKYYCMGFLIDGTPSVRTFANTKDIEKNNKEYITELKQKVKKMTEEELSVVDIISASDYDLYVNGDGKNIYVRDMETGKPKIYVMPEPTQQEKQIAEVNTISNSVELQTKELKDAMIIALLNNDIELQEELKQEYQELMSNTNNEMKEVVEEW